MIPSKVYIVTGATQMLAFVVIFLVCRIFVMSLQDTMACPRDHFKITELENCHRHLNCGDLENMTFIKHLGSGAVKDVFLMNWNNISIVVSVPVNPEMLQDFMSGIETLRLLNPSKYIIQFLGFCETKYALFTEYHSNGDAATLFKTRKSKLSLKESISYCHQYSSILHYLHNSPAGVRVFCDSNSIEKLLSQLLVTLDFKLVLNDVDALPQVVNGSGIKCGHRQLFGTFVAPEQLWHGMGHFNDVLMTGYNEKSDIWKGSAVCEYFLKLAAGGEVLRYRLFELHKSCRRIQPSRRPRVEELVKEYSKVIEELSRHTEL